MGISIHPSLILGVSVDEIVEFKNVSEKFELHDTRTGQPTGKFEYEHKHYVICGDKKHEYDGELYASDIAEVLNDDVEDEAYNVGDYGVVTMNYDTDDYVLGKIILEFDAMYDASHATIDFEELEAAKKELAEKLKNDYNYTGPINVFIKSGVGY
jgi:hypothetical protein